MTKNYDYEVYALLWVSRRSTKIIRELLSRKCKIPRRAIERNFHLTVYHAKKQLPGLISYSRTVSIVADPLETRFMVFVLGGENPIPELEPSDCSVGIRLTRRNQAIEKIQSLRAAVFRFETKEVIGDRKPTSAWKSCFGPRNYQPHIKLLRPGSEIDRNLTKLGEIFRSEINEIEFDRFQVRCDPVRR